MLFLPERDAGAIYDGRARLNLRPGQEVVMYAKLRGMLYDPSLKDNQSDR